jgi:hypothetical protein
MEELELFIKIYQDGIDRSSLEELLQELEDIDDLAVLESFIKKCIEEKSVKDFRDCVKRNIKKEKKRVLEANAQKLKEEQEKRIISTPVPSTNKPPRRKF